MFQAKLKGEVRPFCNGIEYTYPMCEGNVNHYKSLQHPIPTRENREHRGNL